MVDAINWLPFSFPFSFHCCNKKYVFITIAWLPFIMVKSPFSFLTAIPKRSQSGSVPITISAFSFLAKSIAIFNASGSSGFGETTVGKSPLGSACSSTMVTFL